MPDPAGVSSSALRQHDNALRVRRDADLASYNAKLERLKRTHDDTTKQLFEERNRSAQLAHSLGFQSVGEAQFAVEEHQLEGNGGFREILGLVDSLQAELMTSRRENDELREQLKKAQERANTVVATPVKEEPDELMAVELRLLEQRYDGLAEWAKVKAVQYKRDYSRFKAFKEFVLDEANKLYTLVKDKRDSKTPMSPRKRKRSEREAKENCKLKIEELGGLELPDMKDLQIPANLAIEVGDKENTPCSVPTPSPVKKSLYLRATKVESPLVDLSRPSVREDDDGDDVSTEYESSQEEPPSKYRKVSPSPNNELTEPKKLAMRNGVGASPCLSDKNNKSSSTAKPKTEPTPKVNAKGRRSELAAPPLKSTPKAAPDAGSSRQTGDYSAYKGRGRYARQENGAVNQTINGLFEIDSAKNQGLNYQFDEVVRDKEARKRMHAGDCECCRDYYEAVGPLPPRAQAPLWRSPPTSPTKSNSNSVQQHKQQISRHRHTWARAKTPPGYWDIGFPSTQQVGEINRRADEMHQRKLEEVEREAGQSGGASNGRYKRRT